MRKLSYIALVIFGVACGGGRGRGHEETSLNFDDDDRVLPGLSGYKGDDNDTESLGEGDAGLDADALLEGDAGPMAGSGGETGEAGSGEAGNGEAGAGGAGGAAGGQAGVAGGEAGAAGGTAGSMAAGSGSAGGGAFVSSPELFIGDWDWQKEVLSSTECETSFDEMKDAAEAAVYDCSTCKGETSVSDSYAFTSSFTGSKFDRWEDNTWVGVETGTSLFSNPVVTFQQTSMFWLTDENTMFGFSLPDATGLSAGVFCGLYRLVRQ